LHLRDVKIPKNSFFLLGFFSGRNPKYFLTIFNEHGNISKHFRYFRAFFISKSPNITPYFLAFVIGKNPNTFPSLAGPFQGCTNPYAFPHVGDFFWW